jgi:hypothetical protein
VTTIVPYMTTSVMMVSGMRMLAMKAPSGDQDGVTNWPGPWETRRASEPSARAVQTARSSLATNASRVLSGDQAGA